jgi:hypothetical protein
MSFRLYRDAEQKNTMQAADRLDELNNSTEEQYFQDKVCISPQHLNQRTRFSIASQQHYA